MIRWESSNQQVQFDRNTTLCFQRKVDPLRILKIFITASKIDENEADWHVEGKVTFSGKEWDFTSFDLNEGEVKTIGIWDYIFRVVERDCDIASNFDDDSRATLKAQLRGYYNQPLIKLESYYEETVVDSENPLVTNVFLVKSDFLKGVPASEEERKRYPL